MKSAKGVIPFPKASARGKADETRFLPAALEIVEAAASPVGRLVAASIIAIFCFSLAWASLGQIDIVASASGKIVPSGGTKVVQPFETGIVRAIHVRDGQHVKVGDVLIELDPTITESERNHFQSDLMSADLQIAGLKAALVDDGAPMAAFHPPENAAPAQVDLQRAYLIKQRAEHQAKIDALDRQREQKRAEWETIQATITKLSSVMPIVQQRVDIRKASSDREYTSKFQYLEIQQLLVEQQQELLVQRSHAREVAASIEALTEAKAEAAAEYHPPFFPQLAPAHPTPDDHPLNVPNPHTNINTP